VRRLDCFAHVCNKRDPMHTWQGRQAILVGYPGRPNPRRVWPRCNPATTWPRLRQSLRSLWVRALFPLSVRATSLYENLAGHPRGLVTCADTCSGAISSCFRCSGACTSTNPWSALDSVAPAPCALKCAPVMLRLNALAQGPVCPPPPLTPLPSH